MIARPADPRSTPLALPSARLLAPLLLIPLATFVALLVWQDGERSAFRAAQVTFGVVVFAQMALVFARGFTIGWFEFLAYVLHLLTIGAASLTVTFRLEQYPQDLLYDQFAIVGMAGQLTMGVLALRAAPLRIAAPLDTRVLTICAVVVCTAAMIKFYYYLQVVAEAGGHASIYTEGDAVRDNSPAVVRVLSAGAPLIGLLALTYPRMPWWCRLLGALAILLEFAIGIRGRPLFVILSAAAILQASVRLTPLRKAAIVAGAVLAIIVIAAIGYVRESNQSTITDYFWMVLQSLFGIFEAGVLAAQIPDTRSIVTGQIVPLLFPSPIGDIDTVGKLISATYTPVAYVAGYGYSSSALTEVTMLCGPVLAGLVYPLVVVAVMSAIRAAVTSRHTWLFLYGACTMPIAYYIWRAELWQMVVPAIKAGPFILLLLAADAYARLSERRDPLRAADAEPAAS